MGLLLLWSFNLIIILYGLRRVKQEIGQQELPVLFLAAAEEDYVEDLLRYTVRQMKRRALANRLVVLCESSGSQTAVVIRRLSQRLSFIEGEIDRPEEEKEEFGEDCRSNLLDLRGLEKNRKKYRLIRKFLEAKERRYTVNLKA